MMNFYSSWLSPKELSLVVWTLKQSGEDISPWLSLQILGPDVSISSFDGIWGDQPKIFKVSCQCWKALGTHSNSRPPARERGFHSIWLLCTGQNKISNIITLAGVKGLTSQGLKTQAQFLTSLISRKRTLDRESLPRSCFELNLSPLTYFPLSPLPPTSYVLAPS